MQVPCSNWSTDFFSSLFCVVSYWWLQDDITPDGIGEETSHSFEIQSYECKSRKEEHDAKDQLQGPEDLQRSSPVKGKVAEGMHFYLFAFLVEWVHAWHRFCFVILWCFVSYCQQS